MKRNERPVKRYSASFKHQVLKEVESGLSREQVRKKYGLSGSILQYWMRRMGKFDLLPTVIRMETPDERNRIKELERQVRELKAALADTQLARVIAESQLEVVCEQQGLDPDEVKKKLKAKPSSKR